MATAKRLLSGLLAAVAGSVDAVGLWRTGRYSAHVTGTTTHAMTRLADGRVLLALLGASAVAAFVCGAASTGAVLASPRQRGARRSIALLVSVESLAIATGGLAMRLPAHGRWPGMLAIACFAFAMGVQNATSSCLLKPIERTTHITSSLTDFGATLGLRGRGWLGLRAGQAPGRPDGDSLLGAAVPVLGFAAGALCAALVTTVAASWSGLCAAVLPACIAAALSVSRSPGVE